MDKDTIRVKVEDLKYVKQNLLDANATSEDVLEGKTFYSRESNKVQEGKMNPGLYAPIQSISKNNEIIEPDEYKNVNIQLSKKDVGLNNVDNTSDMSKPISLAQKEEFDKVKNNISQLEQNTNNSISNLSSRININKNDIAVLNNNVNVINREINDINNRMTTAETNINSLTNNKQDKLIAGQNIRIDENNIISADDGTTIKINNIIMDNVSFDSDPQTQLDTLNARIDGKQNAFVFDTYANFIGWLNGEYVLNDGKTTNDLQIGSDILIVEDGYPDYWCKSLETPFTSANFVPYESKQQQIDISTTISSASTDDEVPSAKAVYDFVDSNKLIAGENITIENNVISASGGKLNLQDLPQFTNKIYISFKNYSILNGLFTIRIIQSSKFYVNWGDGTGTYYEESTTSITHTYSDTNFDGWITIYGDWKGISSNFNNNNNERFPIREIIYDNNISNNVSHNYLTNLHNINIPNSFTFISSSFAYYTDINDINIPNTIRIINSLAFFHSKIKNIIIPNSVYQLVGTNIFSNNDYLKTIQIESSSITLSSSSSIPTTIKQIFVPQQSLNSYKTATNWNIFSNKIYPIGGSYSATVTIPSTSWTTDTATNISSATVTFAGSTTEARNVIEFTLVDSNGKQIEDTYELNATQGTGQMTFSCTTVPTTDIKIFITSILTNY